ncbi:hypothetical protein KY290_036353 [Solanum tuberosum]|uniref:G-patch domain-containing protein n=1 Tax=Solanum tuberosum TaxID=4113 RepID=A0ABQ7TU00_SOLTU|nr:hypothetical protein KY290_036353 [Solanum tuberosum]
MAQNIQVPLKKVVTQEVAEEFLKKIKVPDYSVVEQLKKTSAQISLFSLLVHCEEHRRVLNKILNEAHVSNETTVNQLEKIAKRIFESNTITFTDDESPTEGAGHNKALLLIVKCEGYYVKSVMIDGGSRDTIGEIKLSMTIGSVGFMIVFQVIDMDTSYNFLLGSPWFHMARVVPSTLHQVVKFEYDHQKIIVYGEDDLPLYRDPSIPYIESFEVVSIDFFNEGDLIIQLCLSSSTSTIATTILKYGYQPGKGLGLCSQGIVDHITLLGNHETSGLGYKQSKINGDKSKKHKRTDWALPQLITHISHSFINPQGPEMEASFTHKYIEEVIKDLSQLFCEVNMVQVGERTSHADVQFLGSGVELNN